MRTAAPSPPPEGATRRQWIRNGLLFAGAAAAGAAASGVSAATLDYLFPPPTFSPGGVPYGGVIDALVYTSFPAAEWWNDRANQPVKVTDFAPWQGATAVWRGLFQNGKWMAGTGYPVLVIRVPRDDTYYSLPTSPPWTLPAGSALYYDDPGRDIRIVVGFDRCTHLCCYPGWHVVTNPAPSRDYLVPPPTYTVYGQDPVYCICHGTQYDPLLLLQDTNPYNGVPFPGMELVHTPGTFAMPLVPVAVTDDTLYGAMADTRWYVYC